MKTRNSKELGQYIVVDPDICHGQPTFKGTRIMVKSVLEMLVKGWEWDRVSAAYDGRIITPQSSKSSRFRRALIEKC